MNTPAAIAGSFPHSLIAVVPCLEIPPDVLIGLVQKFRFAEFLWTLTKRGIKVNCREVRIKSVRHFFVLKKCLTLLMA